MTPEEVEARVAAIREKAWDDETAHVMEDALHQDVLDYISSAADEDIAALAKAALATQEVRFARLCA